MHRQTSTGTGATGASAARAVNARAVNAERLAARTLDVLTHSRTETQVLEPDVSLPAAAVCLLVRQRELLALEHAGVRWFPSWQFAASGTLHPCLAELLAVLPPSVLGADAVMRTPLPEEGGRSPADLLAAGEVSSALHYAATAGGDR